MEVWDQEVQMEQTKEGMKKKVKMRWLKWVWQVELLFIMRVNIT
jgi:hypothetical protein